MKKYQEVKGDLIKLALDKQFDVIAHGCNCFSIMGAGIAVAMAKTFGCDTFPMEFDHDHMGKLGNVDYQTIAIGPSAVYTITSETNLDNDIYELTVVNAYTQFNPGKDLDYNAMALAFKKMNHYFKGQHIGLPQIGCGIAGGDWNVVSKLIQRELKDCNVTVVIYG